MARAVLLETLDALVRLLHPYIPFLTEEVHAKVVAPASNVKSGLLAVQPWPAIEPAARDAAAERETLILRDALRAVRNLRAVFGVPLTAKPDGGVLSAGGPEAAAILEANLDILRDLARVGAVKVGVDLPRPPRSGVDTFEGGAFYLPLDGHVDVAAGIDQLRKKIEKVEAGVRAIDVKLSNAAFVDRADPEVVAGERARKAELEGELALLRRNLEGLA
jgi:valyl-tRNA synthetase